jgi:hypothetical protein
MPIETKTIEVDGTRYTLAQLPALRAWGIGFRLLRQRGRVLASLTLAAEPGAATPGDAWRSLGGAMTIHADTLADPAWWSDVIEPVLSCVSVNGRPVLSPGWEVAFAGPGLAVLLRLYAEAEAWNFAPFFVAALDHGDPAIRDLAAATSETRSPS